MLTKEKIIKEITELRKGYNAKYLSWGEADADKWWETQLRSSLEAVEKQTREETLKEVKETIIPTPRIKLSYFQERFVKENEGVKENNEEMKGWNELRRLQIKAFNKLKSLSNKTETEKE